MHCVLVASTLALISCILHLIFRIVLAGEIAELVVDGSARVFRFDEEYGLTVEQVQINFQEIKYAPDGTFPWVVCFII